VPAPIHPHKKELFLQFIKDGFSQAEAARRAGVSLAWGKAYLKRLKDDSGKSWRELREETTELPGPIPFDDLCLEAQRAFDDIEYFALRYFGAILMPWQLEAAAYIIAAMATDDKEYSVMNMPPGSGKSTFFTLIVPAWLTVRNRAIRGLIVSNTQRNAENYLVNLRRVLDQPLPLKASDNDIRLGIAVDAEASLVMDFGLFKPYADSGDRWTAKAFQVQQHEGVPVSEKESTWQAFGKGGAFLGNRVDVIIPDDVYDRSMIKTSEAREDFMTWYDKHVETRLEPNGTLTLVGQRQDADDIYRHCLDKKVLIDEDGDDIEDESLAQSKYKHLVFKAHYDELCTGEHKEVEPYPVGCLLYPGRIKWRDLRGLTPDVYAVEYQQEDVAPGVTLVDPLWVKGGKDSNGIEYPGCWDSWRDEWQLPELPGDVFVAATIDPSPTKYWAVQVWAWHKETDNRFLVASLRKPMTAPDLLDWDNDRQVFTGLMPLWQQRSKDMGFPIKYWIIENNAAQKFMTQYAHMVRWKQPVGVETVSHNTNWQNKSDPKLGIESLREIWRSGRVRLPGEPYGNGRLDALSLVNEVTKWPEGRTDDTVMAHWFFEWNLPRLYVPSMSGAYSFARPGWMKPNGSPLRSVPA
jgi:hypothetical protein